ncbi:hypothetical protein BGZ83_001449 [Gryganskiella cystojenkinii]|nr:hypothetical protein BGZ83_001449 [Gryganskiella cystojenkinii]
MSSHEADIPTKDIVTDDKENATLLSAPTLVKQGSVLASVTSSHPAKTLARAPSQKNFAKTPSSKGGAMAAPGTPKGGVLGSRTNYAARAMQVLQSQEKKAETKAEENTAVSSIANPLTRTSSVALETAPTTTTTSISTLEKTNEESSSRQPENRRLSLTKRGAAKDRIVVLADVPNELDDQSENDFSGQQDLNGPNKLASRQVKANPVESATTLLSIERAVESEEKVVVGAAKANTKRRALEKDDDRYEIEYCPPPVEEQRYDPGFEIDYSVLSTVPPAIAYHAASLADLPELELPKFEPVNIRRELDRPKGYDPVKDGIVPVTAITHDDRFEVTWGDDEDGAEAEETHPEGGRRFGILDLGNKDKLRQPFDGFAFDLDGSDSSLSADEDDVFSKSLDSAVNGFDKVKAKDANATSSASKAKSDNKAGGLDEFHAAVGLDDLEDESKVQAPILDFTL